MSNVIELRSISKAFGSDYQSKKILKDINLTVESGEFVVLRGSNGAGKTTLLKVILGLLEPTSGNADLMGIPAQFSESKQDVGVVLQETQVPKNLNVRELVTLFQSYYASPISVEEALDRVKLTGKQDSRATSLSGGQKQRLLFALALIGNPKLLVLDEPTRNLDDEGYEEFWEQVEYLKESGVAILMVTNNRADWEKLYCLASRCITLTAFSEESKNSQIEESVLSKVEKLPSTDSSSIEKDLEESKMPSSSQVLMAQLKSEFLQISRTPLYLSFFIVPIVLYFLANQLGDMAKPSAIYISCAFLPAFALQSLAGRIATERSQGWLNLIRSTTLSPTVYISAKILTSLVLCLSAVTLILISISSKVSDFNLGVAELISLLIAFALAAIPIFGLSLTVSYLVDPESLNTVNGFLIVVIALAAGVLPFSTLDWVQILIALSPMYHAQMLILSAANLAPAGYSYSLLNFIWLIWSSIAFCALAVWAYRRDSVTQ